VSDAPHIIDGLCDTWIGNHKLYANIARFDRKDRPKLSFQANSRFSSMGKVNGRSNSSTTYANVVQRGHTGVRHDHRQNEPVIKIEEESLRTLDSSTTVFTCVKEFRALTNMRSICHTEGFTNIKLRYLGGFWISVEFQTMDTCAKFKKHEGVPSQAWTHQAFNKIASKWGQLIYTVDSTGTNMCSACLCIKTSVDSLIYETFKIDVRGHVLSVRAKEITGWVLEFLEDTSQVKSERKGGMEMPMYSDSHVEVKHWDDNDEECVEDSFCNVNDLSPCMKDTSFDPFGLDELINITTKNNKVADLDKPKFPPGFTPVEACNDTNVAKEHLSTTQVDGYVNLNDDGAYQNSQTSNMRKEGEKIEVGVNMNECSKNNDAHEADPNKDIFGSTIGSLQEGVNASQSF
ncbi:hypothetical protein Tco_1452412, partial [Tanacetum coccineum]